MFVLRLENQSFGSNTMTPKPSEIVFYFYIPLIIPQIIIFIVLLNKLYRKNNQDTSAKKLSKCSQILNIICFVGIIGTSIFDMLHGFGAMMLNTVLLSKDKLTTSFHINADIFYFTCSVTLYIMLTHRLYSVFYDTLYKISKYFISFVVMMITIQIVTMTAYMSIIAITECEPKYFCEVVSSLAGVIALNDYILNGILFTIFIRKLRQLVVARLGENDNTMNLKHISGLLNVVVKQTIIGGNLVFVNQTFVTVSFIQFKWGSPSDWEWYLVSVYIIRGVEGCVVCCLLYLGLSINKKTYWKVCGGCHRCCFDLFVHSTTKRMENEEDMMYRLLSTDKF